MVFAFDDKESFEEITTWSRAIDKSASEKIIKVLVGNKCDLPEENKEVSL